MASEIRVNKIINRSGLSTVTFSDTGAIVSGIVTANNFSGNVTGNVTGSGANLTNLPAGQLTGTVADARLTSVTASKLSGALPALDGSALTGINTAFGSGTSVNTTGIITATAFIPTTGQLSHRNLIINGAMQVAQRGTSDSSTNGYGTVDRFGLIRSGVDENPTQEQVNVASGTSPYTLGFRKAFKVTNGNQTGGVGGNDYISMRYKIEAQDIANSGWNYTSATNFVTMSFWVKSSVAQNFYGYFYTHDGTPQGYSFETGSLTANTWTKVVLKIPGNSNLQFDNQSDQGLDIYISQFWGTNRTDPGKSLNSWTAYNGAARMPDFTSTWYTTNDATFEITGVQLEVGSVATPFEHRSFAQEALLCKRYYQQIVGNSDLVMFGSGRASGTSNAIVSTHLAVPLRASPTMNVLAFSGWGISNAHTVTDQPALINFDATHNQLNLNFENLGGNLTNGRTCTVSCSGGSTLKMDSEL